MDAADLITDEFHWINDSNRELRAKLFLKRKTTENLDLNGTELEKLSAGLHRFAPPFTAEQHLA